MIRAGMKLRAGCLALRIRWVEQVEHERDEARASRDEARELRRIAEARATGHQNTSHRLDGAIADAQEVLRQRGHEVGDEVHISRDVRWALERDEQAHHATVARLHREVTGHRNHASHWRRNVAELVGVQAEGTTDTELHRRLQQLVRDGAAAQRQCDELRFRATSRDSMTAMCPSCGTSQDLVVAEHTTSIEDGPGSENPPHTCNGSGIEAEHLPADVGGEGYVVDARIACSREVTVEVNCGDDDEHDGPCWPSPMSLAQRALNAAALNRPDLLGQMRQVWAVVGAAKDNGVDPITELSQVRDALYDAGHPAIRGGFHPGKTVEAVQALVRQHDSTLRAAMKAEQARRAAYDPAMGGDIEPPPGREEPRVRGAAAGLAANLRAAAIRTAQQRDANAGHPAEVLDALQVADDPSAATRNAPAPLDRLCTALTTLARAVRAYPPGMTVDGDMLAEVIGEGLPTQWTDQSCRTTADRILDQAVKAGFTVLHGPELRPREVVEVPF